MMMVEMLTMAFTAAINRGVESVRSGGALPSHAAHAGRHVGLRAFGFTAVWRIVADGSWRSASPLIDADVKIEWRSTAEGVRVEGDAKLLEAVTDFYRAVDWQVVVTEAAGPFLAPRLLYIIDNVADALLDCGRRATVDSTTIKEHGERVDRLWRAVDALANRMANMEAAK